MKRLPSTPPSRWLTTSEAVKGDGGMRQQSVDMRRVLADLTVVPVVGVTGGAEDPSRLSHRRLDPTLAQHQSVGATAGLGSLLGQHLHRVFLRPRDKEADTVQHAADTDPHGLIGNVLEAHRLDEVGGLCGDTGILRHVGEHVSSD